MAPKPPAEAAAPSLPSTTDFNALYNRISLAAAKQNTFLQSMRSKYPSLQKPSAAASAPSPAAPAASTKTGFSSLGPTNTPPAPSTGRSSGPFAKSKAQLRAEQEDAADPLRFDPPNAGLGYIPSKSEAHADAATQELSRKLLGKRAREIKGRNNATAAAKRAAVEDESDDDEGRSGVGRRKRVRVVPVSPTRDEAGKEAGEEETDIADVHVSGVSAEAVSASPEVDSAPKASGLAGSQGKKQKKKKKNKGTTDA